MTLLELIFCAFWVVFTARKHFTPKVAKAIKATVWDMNRAEPDGKKRFARKLRALSAAEWALRVARWIETVLVVLMTITLAVIIGSVIAGTTFVFGFPV